MLREVPQIADSSSAFKGQRDEWCAKGAFWEAHVQERQGSFTEMGKVCDNAVAQYPNASQDSTTWLKVLKAQSLFDAGQLDQAAEILKALRTQNISDQWDATLDVTEGDYYRLSKKYPEAIQAYLQAASGNANDNYSADAKYKLALCYRETGDNDKACGYLQEVIDKYGGTWRKKNAEIALAAWSRVQAGK
jgi:TolA-binding protein